MRPRNIRAACFEPDGRQTLLVMNYDRIVEVCRPRTVQRLLNRIHPGRDTVLVVDELEQELDLAAGEHPLPENRRATGWEDWRMFTRKGPGNSWKIHRQTKFWGGVDRTSIRFQPLINREVR
jgi:hypothetical protein